MLCIPLKSCSSYESAAMRVGVFWSNQHTFAKLCLRPRHYRDWSKSPLGLPRWLSGKEPACNAGDLVQCLDWEDPMEKEMATLPNILAWAIPWTKNLEGYIVHGVTNELDMAYQLNKQKGPLSSLKEGEGVEDRRKVIRLTEVYQNYNSLSGPSFPIKTRNFK